MDQALNEGHLEYLFVMNGAVAKEASLAEEFSVI